MVDNMNWFSEARGLIVGDWGNDLSDSDFTLALLTLGIASNYPYTWREKLLLWPENKPLPWGPQSERDDAESPVHFLTRAWPSFVGMSPHEAVATGQALFKVGEKRGERKIAINLDIISNNRRTWVRSRYLFSVFSVFSKFSVIEFVSFDEKNSSKNLQSIYKSYYFYRAARGTWFSIGDELPIYLLIVGVLARYPDTWQEVLATWPLDKILPWGAQSDREISQGHWQASFYSSNFENEFGEILNRLPERIDIIARNFLERFPDGDKPVISINESLLTDHRPKDISERDIFRMLGQLSRVAHIKFHDGKSLLTQQSFEDDKIFIDNGDVRYLDSLSFAAETPAAPTQPYRYLRGSVAERGADGTLRRSAYFRPGIEHIVFVWIAPLALGETVHGPAFPEDDLETGPQGSELDVVLVEPKQLEKPLVRRLLLPYEGTSARCAFPLPRLRPGRFDGTILILHRFRVLQTATISGSVTLSDDLTAERLGFAIDAVVRRDLSNLERRQEFDASIVITPAGKHIAIAKGSIHVTYIDGNDLSEKLKQVSGAFNTIKNELDIAARQTKPNMAKLLRVCAHHGILIRKAILRGCPEQMSRANAIQLISSMPESVLPLEFAYDGKAPTTNAQICNCIDIGENEICANANSSDVICTRSFWGLSRIIERHAYDPKESMLENLPAESGLNGKQGAFGPLVGAVVAASSRAEDKDSDGKVSDVIAALNAANIPANRAFDWAEWCRRIDEMSAQDNQSALLIILPHTNYNSSIKMDELEIGKDSRLLLSEIENKHIARGNSLVVLLGCKTACSPNAISSFVSGFACEGAKIVIGTTTAILGIHAVPLAKALAEGLGKAQKEQVPSSLGVLMRDLRRKFLAQNMPLALSTVAFGDADWLFGDVRDDRGE